MLLRYYNSHMDDKDRLGSNGELAVHLTRLATTVAQTLYQMSTGVERHDITANESTVRIVLSVIVTLSVTCVDDQRSLICYYLRQRI